MVQKCNVLFLCGANSARSVMDEALQRESGGLRFDAFGADNEPAVDVHPWTLEQRRPTISGLGKLRAKTWDPFVGPSAPEMDVAIATCCGGAGPSRCCGICLKTQDGRSGLWVGCFRTRD